MELGAEVKVATIVLWNFVALIINIGALVIMHMKANKNITLKAFFVVQAGMIIWLVGKIFKTVSPTVELRWFFIVFYYLGICLLEVAFFEFAYIYLKEKKLDKKVKWIIYAIGFIQFVIVAINPLHYKFYSIFDFWGDEFGPLFYVHVVINYLFILTGMFMCSIKFKQQVKNKSKIEQNLIFMAILVPLVFNFIYITRMLEAVFDYLNIQIFDTTPIVYTWSILIFVYATFKYEFFYVNPIMKHEVSKKLDNPVLVMDKRYTKVYANAEFENTMENAIKTIIDEIKKGKDTVIQLGDKYYYYCLNQHKSYGGIKSIVCFTDITMYEKAKEEVNKENKELALSNTKLENQIEMLKQTSQVGARNYMARELHDILGHSLVVTIKLLEVSRLYYKTNRQRAMESLDNAVKSIQKGFEGMKTIQDKDNALIYNTTALEKELKSMLTIVAVSGIEVNFYLRGTKMLLDETIYDTLKKIVTELVTNTLKHAKATQMLVSITIADKRLTLRTMDNGKGNPCLTKGNGLTGIDGRVALVGGSAKYTTAPEEGFVSNICIPLEI